jgi:hypothetical protein
MTIGDVPGRIAAALLKAESRIVPCHILFTWRSVGGAFMPPDPQELQRNYREFLDLLPLTLALAGLPESEKGKYFTEEQIEARGFTLRYAHRAARQLARELIQPKSSS